jgi:uncharacterized membrane protein
VRAKRARALGLLWIFLGAAYVFASAAGHREATLAIVGLMIGALAIASGAPLAGTVLGGVLAVAAWHFADTLPFLAYVPPLVAFALMAVFFARTLREGSEPLINRIARREHPDLPPDMARHARRLTAIWAGCFVVLFLVALGLAPFLPLESWARWVQGLGYLVPGALFVGEHAYRLRRFPERAQGSLPELVPHVLAVMREMALEPAPPARPGREGR